MAKYSSESNLANLTIIIGRQLKLLSSLSDEEILERGLFKLVSEYGKLIVLSLREEREQLRSLSIETMSDEELYKAVREEVISVKSNTKQLGNKDE